MTTVTVPFNGKPLSFEIPDTSPVAVLSPKPAAPIADPDAAITAALAAPIGRPPLRETLKPTDSVLLVTDDNTRLTPVAKLLPPLLAEIRSAKIPDNRISIVMALGTHRPMTEEEMRLRVGDDVFSRHRVFNHEWNNPDALADMGVSAHGTPLFINRAAVEADVVIGVGAVVPHHIPGFSGSSKIIQPGICGAKTTAETHLLSTQTDDSLLGIIDNPVRRDMDDIAGRVGMDTILNVTLNAQGETAGIFFGEMRPAFQQAVERAKEIYGVPYSEPADIVVANSHPCDIDFWQSHKSLYPAARIVKPGGTIIVMTPAPEGVSPVHKDLLTYTDWDSTTIEAAYRRGDIKNGVAAALAVAWAKVREKAPVIMVSPGISDTDKQKLGFTPAPDITAALTEALRRQGKSARIAVLTHAPDMLPIPAF